jgi:hypothetical protein
MTNGRSHDDGTVGDDEIAWLARPARGIVNRVVRELGPLCPAAPALGAALRS